MRNKLFMMVALIMCMAMLLSACGSNNNSNVNGNNGSSIVNGTDNNNQDVENNNDNNTNGELVNKPNSWDPESENLVGLGVYIIKNNNIPFEDGQIINPTIVENVATFDNFSVWYFTDYTYGAMAQKVVDYKFVSDAEFAKIRFYKNEDCELSNIIELSMRVEENYATHYVVGYIYNANNSIFMKIDTNVCEVYNPQDEYASENAQNYYVSKSTNRKMIDGLNNAQFRDQEFDVEIIFQFRMITNNSSNALSEYDSIILELNTKDGTTTFEEYDFSNLPNNIEWKSEYAKIVAYGVVNGEKTSLWYNDVNFGTFDESAEITVMHQGVSFVWRFTVTRDN